MLGHNQMTLYPYDKSTHPSNILFLKTTQGEKENQHTVKKSLQSSIFLFLYFIPKKKHIQDLFVVPTIHQALSGHWGISRKPKVSLFMKPAF